MSKLPVELLRLVVRHLAGDGDYASRRGLANLRLTNKELSSYAATFYFEVIPLWLSTRSLENLTALSKQDELAQHVKTLNFSPLAFRDPSNRKPSAPADDEVSKAHEADDELDQSEYRTALAANFSMQQSLISGRASDIMTSAFKKMPNIHCLDMSRLQWVGALELSKSMSSWDGLETDFDSSSALRCLFRSFLDAGVSMRSVILSPDREGVQAETKVRSYSPIVDKKSSMRSLLAFIEVQKFKEESVLLLKNLASLEMNFEPPKDEKDLEPITSTDLALFLIMIGPLLKTAHKLRYFTATFGPTPDRGKILETVLVKCSPRNLVELRLTSMFVESNALSTFISHNAATLKVVELKLIVVMHENHRGSERSAVQSRFSVWEETLARLRNVPFPALLTFQLSDIIDSTLGNCDPFCDLADYLTQRTDQSPLHKIMPRRPPGVSATANTNSAPLPARN